MSLWKIAWRSIQQRSLSSALTALSMALGVALVVAVLVIYGVVQASFSRAAQGFDMIVGAKGGKLQLVLNTVYHLSTPIENVPWDYYQEFKRGRFAKSVAAAIPFCLGDSYEGHRVVGTIPELFDEIEYVPGEKYTFAQGRNFQSENFFEAVIGDLVARRTGLKLGSEFRPSHGVTDNATQHDDNFKVVGVLAPTGTPNDRAVFVNIEGFFLMEGHAKPKPKDKGAPAAEPAAPQADGEPEAEPKPDGETAGEAPATTGGARQPQPLPEDQREVTAILVRSASPIIGATLPRMINKEPFAQSVAPAREIQNLFEGMLGNVQTLLWVLAVLVVVVAAVSILVGIYNSMNDRRREIAVMRALGARRETVMLVVLCESLLLALGGGALGLLLGHGAIGLVSPWIATQTGVSIGLLQFSPLELTLIPLLVGLAVIAGFLPALVAYRTDVARALSAAP